MSGRTHVHCRNCDSSLQRPGDYCLVCREPNADAVVAVVGNERTALSVFSGEEHLGDTTITTHPETADPEQEVQERNYIAQTAAEVRRKRPEAVYVSGERDLINRLRNELTADVYRIDSEDPVAAYRERIADPPLAVVDRDPADKLGGRHSTLIAGRRGRRAIQSIAEHPHVKKIIPGPIDGSGSGSRAGFRAKVTRPDHGGNLRVLLHDGSTVQEVRLVTTASNLTDGERIAEQLNEAFDAER